MQHRLEDPVASYFRLDDLLGQTQAANASQNAEPGVGTVFALHLEDELWESCWPLVRNTKLPGVEGTVDMTKLRGRHKENLPLALCELSAEWRAGGHEQFPEWDGFLRVRLPSKLRALYKQAWPDRFDSHGKMDRDTPGEWSLNHPVGSEEGAEDELLDLLPESDFPAVSTEQLYREMASASLPASAASYVAAGLTAVQAGGFTPYKLGLLGGADRTEARRHTPTRAHIALTNFAEMVRPEEPLASIAPVYGATLALTIDPRRDTMAAAPSGYVVRFTSGEWNIVNEVSQHFGASVLALQATRAQAWVMREAGSDFNRLPDRRARVARERFAFHAKIA